ncbi:MAG TPA: hypothetical protein V6C57_15085 [Coleofasciculaceae cyanobacterium]
MASTVVVPGDRVYVPYGVPYGDRPWTEGILRQLLNLSSCLTCVKLKTEAIRIDQEKTSDRCGLWSVKHSRGERFG